MALPQHSILDRLIADLEQPAADRQGFGLSSRITFQGEEIIAVGVDNGNDALKLTMLDDTTKLVQLRIPTAYMPARIIRGGAGERTYTIDGETMWIGDTAVRNNGQGLRIGSTAQRLIDDRHRQFLAAALVELLTKAGYAPGAYQLAIGFAIPNTEIESDAKVDKLGVSEQTRDVLKKWLYKATWAVERLDERGRRSVWTITARHVLPQAQSLGTFVAWSKSPLGDTVATRSAVSIIDIGGGDLQRTDVTVKPYQMMTDRLGSGTIDVARALRQQLIKAKRGTIDDNVLLQHALVTRQLMVSGDIVGIDKEVETSLKTHGNDLISKVLPALQQTSRYVIITGGGVLLLHDLLIESVETVGKQQPQDYLVVNHGLAAILNSVGALFAVLFMLAAKRG